MKSISRSSFFKTITIILAITGLLSLLLDVQQFIERDKFEIPIWFLIALLLINTLYFGSLWQIYNYRKWAIFVLPLCILAHFCLMHQYMNSFLYADLFNLFFFITVGLLEFVFQWKKFK
jgi:hypothetical protein